MGISELVALSINKFIAKTRVKREDIKLPFTNLLQKNSSIEQ
jgi:hypothetical protein